MVTVCPVSGNTSPSVQARITAVSMRRLRRDQDTVTGPPDAAKLGTLNAATPAMTTLAGRKGRYALALRNFVMVGASEISSLPTEVTGSNW